MACKIGHDDCPYEKILDCHFVGRYLGLKKNKDYGTLRAVFEVDRSNCQNKEFLGIIEEMRQHTSEHKKRVIHYYRDFRSATKNQRKISRKFVRKTGN